MLVTLKPRFSYCLTRLPGVSVFAAAVDGVLRESSLGGVVDKRLEGGEKAAEEEEEDSKGMCLGTFDKDSLENDEDEEDEAASVFMAC